MHTPDITITREDVLALPVRNNGDLLAVPKEGRAWYVVPYGAGRLAWSDMPAGLAFAQRRDEQGVAFHGGRHLEAPEADAAERAFLWRTALASDAALADMSGVAEEVLVRHTRDAMRRISERPGLPH